MLLLGSSTRRKRGPGVWSTPEGGWSVWKKTSFRGLANCRSNRFLLLCFCRPFAAAKRGGVGIAVFCVGSLRADFWLGYRHWPVRQEFRSGPSRCSAPSADETHGSHPGAERGSLVYVGHSCR